MLLSAPWVKVNIILCKSKRWKIHPLHFTQMIGMDVPRRICQASQAKGVSTSKWLCIRVEAIVFAWGLQCIPYEELLSTSICYFFSSSQEKMIPLASIALLSLSFGVSPLSADPVCLGVCNTDCNCTGELPRLPSPPPGNCKYTYKLNWNSIINWGSIYK